MFSALVDLSHTLGYILGGMLVGPWCVNFIDRVVQVETLAQFGSIFMLFGHGLIYSQHYRATSTYILRSGGGIDKETPGLPDSFPSIPPAHAPRFNSLVREDFLDTHGNSVNHVNDRSWGNLYNDSVTGGFIFVVCLFVVTLLLIELTSIVSSWLEGILLALAMSLSSTSVVMDTLLHTRLRETLYGTVVIEIMAVQVWHLCSPCATDELFPVSNRKNI